MSERVISYCSTKRELHLEWYCVKFTTVPECGRVEAGAKVDRRERDKGLDVFAESDHRKFGKSLAFQFRQSSWKRWIIIPLLRWSERGRSLIQFIFRPITGVPIRRRLNCSEQGLFPGALFSPSLFFPLPLPLRRRFRSPQLPARPTICPWVSEDGWILGRRKTWVGSWTALPRFSSRPSFPSAPWSPWGLGSLNDQISKWQPERETAVISLLRRFRWTCCGDAIVGGLQILDESTL